MSRQCLEVIRTGLSDANAIELLVEADALGLILALKDVCMEYVLASIKKEIIVSLSPSLPGNGRVALQSCRKAFLNRNGKVFLLLVQDDLGCLFQIICFYCDFSFHRVGMYISSLQFCKPNCHHVTEIGQCLFI